MSGLQQKAEAAMQIVILYDITNDRIRAKVADECLNYGLDRTQFSAFIGELTRTHQEELMLKLTKRLGKSPGAVLLIPVGAQEWERRFEVRNEADWEPDAEEPETDGA